MLNEDRVVTTKLSADLVAALDKWADRGQRTKSWIMRQALKEWISEQERRYRLTLEALASCDSGDILSHEEVVALMVQLKAERRAASSGRSTPTDQD